MESDSAPSPDSRAARMAAQTRADILDAARALFAANGYAATSIADIARQAGVAVQTIYSHLGSKHGMLMALVDRIDAESGMEEIAPRIFEARDPAEALGHFIGLTRSFQERCGDVIGALFSAAAFEPGLTSAVNAGRDRHRDGARRTIAHIASLGGLSPNLEQEAATAVLVLSTAHESWRELTAVAGLDWPEAERVLTVALGASLLGG